MPVEIVRRGGGKKYPAAKLKRVAARILKLLKTDKAELSVALIGNGEMRKLNARYRKKDYPTDVLSFPAAQDMPDGIRLLGDVIISVDKANGRDEGVRLTFLLVFCLRKRSKRFA